jgi:hypothetical protein
MKCFVLFSVSIFFFSACSDFQHMHYRKLKKVPAHGFVKPRAEAEIIPANEIVLPATSDSSATAKIPNPEIIAISPVVKVKKPVHSLPASGKKQLRKIGSVKKTVVEKIQTKQNSIQKKEGKFKSILLLLFFLGLGLWAIAVGVLMIAYAFYPFSLVLVVGGIAFIFFGFIPFIQLILRIKNNRHEKLHGSFEEKNRGKKTR